MTAQEYALRILYVLADMVPGIVAAVVVSLVALVVLYVMARNAWLQNKRFRIVSIFFGMQAKGRFRLACIWLKLVFVCYFIVAFQTMDLLHYWMVLLPGLLAAFTDTGLRKWLENLFWLCIQLMGLLSANMICRFLRQMSGGGFFLLIYIAVGMFLALLSVYLFLSELVSISAHRSVDAREVWGPDEVQ